MILVGRMLSNVTQLFILLLQSAAAVLLEVHGFWAAASPVTTVKIAMLAFWQPNIQFVSHTHAHSMLVRQCHSTA